MANTHILPDVDKDQPCVGIKQTAEPEYAVIGKEREYLREGVEHEQYPQERASAL